jgi:hypothetical protein
VERAAAAEAEREAARHRNSGLVVATPAPVAAPEVQTAAQGERRRGRPMRDAGFFSSFLCFLDGEGGIGSFLPCWFRLQHMAGRRIMYMLGTGKHKEAGS